VRTAILTAILLTAIPAFAQQNTTAVEAECAEKFKATDLNNDGVITHTEIAKAQQLPPTLAKESLVSRNAFMWACAHMVSAQTGQVDKSAPPSPHSTGTTVSPPENKGEKQPQGPTGPLNTKTGGAPAESPQGQTPPGMQAAPDGSSKTIIDPDTKAK
jgi:hypothetical protein